MLKPCFNRVLIQLREQKDSTVIVRPADSPIGEFDRWTVQSIGPDVKCCVAGDVVVLVPGANVLPLPDFVTNRIGLIHDTSVVMIEAKD